MEWVSALVPLSALSRHHTPLPVSSCTGTLFAAGVTNCRSLLIAASAAWVGDRYHMRGPIIVFNCILTLIGLPLMGFTDSPAVRYFGVFLTTAGANSNVPSIMAYQANNIRGQWKRAFCSASLVGLGGVGGIAGSLVFRSQDAPRYIWGIVACIVCGAVIILIVGALSVKFYLDNKKQAQGKLIIEGIDVSFPFSSSARQHRIQTLINLTGWIPLHDLMTGLVFSLTIFIYFIALPVSLLDITSRKTSEALCCRFAQACT